MRGARLHKRDGKTCFWRATGRDGPFPAHDLVGAIRFRGMKAGRDFAAGESADMKRWRISSESAATLRSNDRTRAEALLAMQREDGHFVFELEADATIPAGVRAAGPLSRRDTEPELERRIGAHICAASRPITAGGRFITAAPSTSARPSRPISR